MKVTLNKNQLGHILRLIRMKGVVYYDVKMEMTDHIASEVEEEIERSGLKYMHAVKKVFLRYDRFHFMKIEEEKTKKIQKQSWKQIWKSFLQFFNIPKVLITISMFLMFQFIIENGLGDYIKYVLGACMIITSLFLFYLKRKWIGKENYLQLHKFFGGFFILFQIIFHGMRYSPKYDFGYGAMFYAVFSTFSFLILFIVIEIYTNELKTLKMQFV